MGFGADFLVGGTASSDGGYTPAANGFDDNTATYYQNYNEVPCLAQYDLGEGVTKVAAKYTIQISIYPQYPPAAWRFEGSNDGINWTTLDEQSGVSWSEAYEKHEYLISNTTAYRYYRWYFTAPSNAICIAEFEAMESSGPTIADPANYLHARRDRMNMKGVSLQNSAV